jgi:uncharacterized membrane protein
MKSHVLNPGKPELNQSVQEKFRRLMEMKELVPPSEYPESERLFDIGMDSANYSASCGSGSCSGSCGGGGGSCHVMKAEEE